MQKFIYGLDWIRLSRSQETQRRMIEIVRMRKTRTHTHTHPPTHPHTHTRKLINITVERVSMDENIWHPSFFQNNPLTNPSFFMGKIWPPSFLENITKTQPLPPIHKGKIPIMVAGLKCLKVMQFQRNFFYFKGLKLSHKMIAKSMQVQNSIANSWINCNFTVNSFAVNSYVSIKGWKLKIYWW